MLEVFELLQNPVPGIRLVDTTRNASGFLRYHSSLVMNNESTSLLLFGKSPRLAVRFGPPPVFLRAIEVSQSP